MRKTLVLTAIIICFAASCCKAQYAAIPDSAFRATLQSLYPACMNAQGQLDTACSEVLNTHSLSFISYGYEDPAFKIGNFEGLQYFKNLDSFFFNYANIYDTITTTIPALPANLKHLELGDAKVISLGPLPPTLKYFNCSRTLLSALPVLPQNLNVLKCSSVNNGRLGSLPALPSALDSLDCSSNIGLSILPQLPSSLTYLNCMDDSLTSLPDLPASLTVLAVSGQGVRGSPGVPCLSGLPTLPASLKILECSSNNISVFPDFPNGLEQLVVSYNPASSLPRLPDSLWLAYFQRMSLATLPVLPMKLRNLAVTENPSITSLPELPNSLRWLLCTGNSRLAALPSLPAALGFIDCRGNRLISLPRLPDSLQQLDCSFNQITELPELPGSLQNLACSHNQLSVLPELPNSIVLLECIYNNLYCLPKIPASLQYAAYDMSKIKCIPNLSPAIPGLPLCNPTNNSNHCQSFPVLSGTVFYDNNSNGSKDPGELYKRNIKAELLTKQYTFTNNDGYFEINANDLGTSAISIIAPPFYNAVPASSTYNFTRFDTIVSKQYALQPNRIFDSIAIKIIPSWAARPGFSFQYYIHYENTGTTTVNTNLVFNYDNARLVYDSSSNPATVNNNNSLSVDLVNIVPGQVGGFVGYFTINTSTSLDDVLFAKATMQANNVNYYDSCFVGVRGSFDPNDKQATPQLSPSQVANGEYIDYTIRFQNTGTDTAFTVVISDTLSEDLQANSLQMIATSHNCKTTVKDTIVFFEFINILLPDSNVNEPKSHGFISFRLKPEPTVSINTTIPNKAAIYFDYNAPVITNTAGTLIKEFTVIPLKLISFSAVPQNDNTITLYWSTTNEINSKQFVIERSNDGLRFSSITNVFAKGKVNNNYHTIVADANTGIIFYRLKMVDNDGNFAYSPIIKIDRRKNTSGIAVMTNPVKDFVIINTNDRSLNNTQCNIINTQGAIVKTFIIKQGSQAIDIKRLPNGVYYLRTANGSSRILKQ